MKKTFEKTYSSEKKKYEKIYEEKMKSIYEQLKKGIVMNVGSLYINGEITDKFFYLLSFYDRLNLTKCCSSSF